MNDWDFETHLRRYRTLFGVGPGGNPEVAMAAERKAQGAHALSLFNPLRDWFPSAIQLSGKLSNDEAKFFMKFGVGRRLDMMFHAYRHITTVAHAERTEPLNHEEQQDLTQYINVLYLQTRGVLDNLAWCLLYERHPEVAPAVSQNTVGLFSAKFPSLPI